MLSFCGKFMPLFVCACEFGVRDMFNIDIISSNDARTFVTIEEAEENIY